MSNCCGIGSDVNIELEIAKMEAKKYAITHQKTVAIYEEDGKYQFAEANEILASGKSAIEILSQHQ